MTKMPCVMDVWVTEWNPSGAGGTTQNWLGGLITLALLDAFLQHKVTLTCHHTLREAFGRGGPREQSTDLNAAGLTLHVFARATTGMTSAVPIRFADNSMLRGWQFSDEKTQRIFLLNFTAMPHRISTAALSKSHTEIIQLTAAPDSPAGNIKEIRLPTSPTLALAAYSATLIR